MQYLQNQRRCYQMKISIKTNLYDILDKFQWKWVNVWLNDGKILKVFLLDIDFLEDIWVKLAEFYPPLHFGGLEPREYITKYIQDSFSHHRANLEPDGPGTGGTIVGVMAGGHVIHDLEEMIDDTVCTLSLNSESFDYQDWKNKWRGKA